MATNDLISTMFEEPEVAGLQRQRQLAQLLIQQGAQTPQNQMVNGLYVPVNPMERVANLGSLLMGMKSSENLDEKQSELAAALRQKEMGALQKYLQLKRGTPGQEGTPDFVQAGPMPDGSNIPVQPGRQAIAAVPGDAEAANMYAASNPYSKVLREMGMKGLSKEPKWEKSERNLGNGVIEYGWSDVNSDRPDQTFRPTGKGYDKAYLDMVDEGRAMPGGAQPMSYAPQGGAAPQGRIGGFENSITNLWPREGGYTPKDGSSGAPANFGINQKFHPNIDVSKLTQDQAKQIYKRDYWDAIGADRLPPAAQEIAFDAAVNQGPEFAKQMLAATNGDPMAMLQMRAQRYAETAKRSPEDAKNYQGWMNRLNSVGQLALSGQSGQTGQPGQIPPSPKQQRAVAQKVAENRAEYAEKAPGAIAVMDETIKNINDMIGSAKVVDGKLEQGDTAAHPGFKGAVGMSGLMTGFGASGFIPGTDVSNFKARMEQIQGKTFMQAFESLKGAGQITEQEGAKATAALNRMKLSQSEKEFVEAAREFEQNVKKGIELAKNRAGLPPGAAGGWSVISVNPGK